MTHPEEITIETVANEVTVQTVVNQVTIAARGPQGIPGPEGPPGAASGSFTQSFTDANFVAVVHNLGFYPNVAVIVNGEEIAGFDITHLNVNQLTVSWNSVLLTGDVVCS